MESSCKAWHWSRALRLSCVRGLYIRLDKCIQIQDGSSGTPTHTRRSDPNKDVPGCDVALSVFSSGSTTPITQDLHTNIFKSRSLASRCAVERLSAQVCSIAFFVESSWFKLFIVAMDTVRITGPFTLETHAAKTQTATARRRRSV